MSKYFLRPGRGVKNTVAAVLSVTLLCAPLASVFAQTDSTSSDATGTKSIITQTPVNTVPASSTDDNTTNTTESSAPAGDSSTGLPSAVDSIQGFTPTDAEKSAGVDTSSVTSLSSAKVGIKPAVSGGGNPAPTVSNPTLFTYQTLAPKVDAASGALTQSVPLDIPPGRNGLQPEVSLLYNSQDMQDGIVGYNWSLSIPYIQRLNKTGTDRVYADNYFTSSVSGELAAAASTTPNTYYARVDDGSFITYVFANNTWTAYDKNGTRYEYGATTQAQQYDAASSTQVYKWMLEEVRDTNGNYISYTYTKDNNQIYPSQITYTGNGTIAGVMSVTFVTAARPDPYTDYRSTFGITTNDRISEIDAKVNGQLVRKYVLSYGTGNNGVRSLLSSVQETGQDIHNNQLTLPAITFQYANTPVTWTFSAGFGHVADQTNVAADANGDGINDTAIAGSLSCGGTPMLSINGTGVTPPSYTWACIAANGQNTPVESGTRFVDVDGDGSADVVHNLQNSFIPQDTTGVTFYKNTSATNGNYTFSSTATSSMNIPPFAFYATGANQTYSTGLFGNINGDGYVDYVDGVQGVTLNASSTYLGNGNGWRTSSSFPGVQSMPGYNGYPATNSQLIDINGDGLDDWVYSDSSNIYVCPNTGTGWNCSAGTQWTIATSSLYSVGGQYFDRGMRFLDINGDGLPDFVRSYYSPIVNNTHGSAEISNGYTFVLLNTGSGWATSTISLPAHITSYNQYDGLTNLEYADWNGDGIPDNVNSKNNAIRQDILTQINYPKGGNTQISYMPSPQTGTNPHLPISLLLVSKIVTNDTNGNSAEVDYTYSGGKLYLNAAAPQDRKFAGFYTITEKHPDYTRTTYYNQGDGVTVSDGEQTDGYPHIGHVFREDITTPGGILVKKTLNRWDAIQHASTNSTFVALGEQQVQDYTASGSHQDAVTEYTYSPTTDDLLQTDEYGILGPGNRRTTQYTYASNDSLHLRVPIEKKIVTVASAPSTTVRVLVVAGGGSGGGSGSIGCPGGGGGGGGVQDISSVSVTTGTYPISVGGSDQNSAFGSSVLSIAGGGGGTSCGAGAGGGSGGGGTSGGSGTLGQGYAGGSAVSGQRGAAGGGGAGQIGGAPNGGASGGAGGNGISSNISGSSMYYGGGGGGGADYYYGGSAGVGGNGGGGNGAGFFAGTGGPANGGANTGGGGGGVSNQSVGSLTGATGGSGIVVISAPQGTIYASGGSHTIVGGNDLWTFVSGGIWQVASINVASSAVVSDTQYYYDTLPFGSVSLGNQTTQAHWITGNTYASTTKAYNSYGLVTASVDPDGNQASYTYDAYNLYPATKTNALSQVTADTYDYATGKVVQETDPNSLSTKNVYDPVGRLIEQDEPDFNIPSTLVPKQIITYTDTGFPTYTQTTSYLTSATSSVSYTYFDGLGRTIQTRSQAPGNNTYVVQDTLYGSAGLVTSASLPYFASSTSYTAPTSTSALFTTYQYDPLQRVTAVTNAVGTTGTAYNAWTTTVTDPNGTAKDLTRDAYQNLVQVVEHNKGSLYTTNYGYDLLGNLTNVTDSLGNVRNITYDGLGRLLTAQDLHAVGDTTYGTTTYAYDAAGNLLQKIDPKSQMVQYTYDALNRPLTEDYTGQAGIEVAYTYDSCTDGIGHVCIASSTSAYTTYAYNPLELKSVESVTIVGTSTPFATQYAYDRQGNTTAITYPDNSQVQYTHNAAGLVDSVQQKPNGGSFANVINSLSYAPTGQVARTLYASGASTSYTYDPNQAYRLTRILTLGAATTTVTTLTPLQILVVAGGGGGAGANAGNGGGGGGGGGVVSNSTLTIPVGTYAITVGSGGAGGAFGTTNSGSQGATSSIGSLVVAIGGGYGSATDGNGNALPGGNGGSGGGAGAGYVTGNTGGTAAAGQGNSGGASIGYSFAAGGGGGAGAVGNTAPAGGHGADGGIGIQNSITGVLTYYAGGGGGGGGIVGGNGGAGGGGGSVSYNGTAGTANTGGGGGGGSVGNGGAGGAGGSGIVIIGYPTADAADYTCGSTATTTVGLYTICTFTSNGTFTVTDARVISTHNQILQDVNYAYDADGNILTRTDNSDAGQGQAIVYTYDNLSRLTSASTTLSYLNPHQFNQTFSYDALGNLVTSPLGSYTYAGNMGTNYANPDAATAIASSTYAYDNNGNLLTTSSTSYTWDYRNRLTQLVNGVVTTYRYDFQGNRVFQQTGSSTTIYPSKYFSEVLNGTSTDYVWSGDTLLAYVEQPLVNGTATGTPKTYYVHPDNLGSTNAISDSSGNVVQVLDYYPYGATRINNTTGGYDSQRKWIGQYSDSSGLNYLNARYEDPTRGQFLSEDPSFLAVGTPALTEILNRVNTNKGSSYNGWTAGRQLNDRQALQVFLSDPQLMNSYGYGRDNPIINKDPTGEVIPLLPIIAVYGAAQTLVDLYEAKTVFVDYPDQFTAQDKKDVGFKLGLDALLSGTSRVAKAGEKIILETWPVVLDVLDHYFGRQIYQNINYGNVQSQTSVQSRQQFVQSYNSSFGLSTGGGGGAPSSNSLWVTPSGAVVTFGGQLVAPPPSSKK